MRDWRNSLQDSLSDPKDTWFAPYTEAGHDIESLFDPKGEHKCGLCGENMIDLSEDLAYGDMRTCKPKP